MKDFAAIDFETANSERSSVCSVGVVIVRNNEIVDSFYSLINPDQGNDSCAGEILEAAKEIYQKHGCSQEFLYDWQMLINEVKAYQQESPEQVQLPKLTHTETELIREEMQQKGMAY